MLFECTPETERTSDEMGEAITSVHIQPTVGEVQEQVDEKELDAE